MKIFTASHHREKKFNFLHFRHIEVVGKGYLCGLGHFTLSGIEMSLLFLNLDELLETVTINNVKQAYVKKLLFL